MGHPVQEKMAYNSDYLSMLSGVNEKYLSDLYNKYLSNPASVDPSWQEFFTELGDDLATVAANTEGPSWDAGLGPLVTEDDREAATEAAKKDKGGVSKEKARQEILDSIRVLMMIRTYRVRGHLMADLDPLGLENSTEIHPELDYKSYGFTEEDLDREFFLNFVLGLEQATLREVLEILKRTYCSTIGVEFMHIQDPDEKAWIQEHIEGRNKEVRFTTEGKKAILNKLCEAEGFERFLNVKYTGTKRFGLDGGEALVPMIENIIKYGGHLGMDELVLGMPHRGRLNVLANVMQKPFRAIFNEFQGGSSNPEDVQGSGDVKYHLGTSADRDFDGNVVHLSLTANPSHLEAVNPVVEGKVRAKQEQKNDTDRIRVLPLLLHGDAAFAGQGLVAETMGLSQLKGHRTGGTIHIIVNNQIGFTTHPSYSRSSPYPSDVAKMVQAPIFHVNGDDPEAVCHVAKLAIEFRQKFHRDVVIDMFCYRRHGHNESDEPAFTQPVMYRTIAKHPTTRQIYAKKLVDEGTLTADEAEDMLKSFNNFLEEEFEASKAFKPNKADWLEGRWQGFDVAEEGDRRGTTAVEIDKLKEYGKVLTTEPEGFNMHRTVKRQLGAKAKMFTEDTGIDWATGEALAFASLVDEGHYVRLSGQDCGRGTFSQRHAVWTDQITENKYRPLQHISKDQAGFEVIDSMLSEQAVLGFEYGYSLAEPKALVIWEAQFGDFANGAQVIIDQFISSGESKWLRMCGLVMMLPHGYEGQGPEHSSCRIERYLQMCGEDNWQIANVTTPANLFHLLRRQIHRKFRKPLVIPTPKSLLRHKKVVSKLEDFGPGSTFHRVLNDSEESSLVADKKIKRVLLCTGKVYYDLIEERENRGIDDIYILRVEQLYPFPHHTLVEELKRFPNADVVWTQEEHENMGAYDFVFRRLNKVLVEAGSKVQWPGYAGRPESAATATGLASKHKAELAALLDQAFNM